MEVTVNRRTRIGFALTLSLLVLSPLFASGQQGEPATRPAPRPTAELFRTPPRVDRLPNGLTVMSIPWDSPGIVAYYTLVRVGSRDEVEPGKSGYAHLFEHMMFRGTERFPEAAYEAKIQSFGADNNAYTTQDFTLYTATLPSGVLSEIVEIEADRFQRLAYDEEQYRTETGAVLGEYNKNASNPFLKMWETLSEMGFSRHTYGHTTMGYLRDIQAMPENLRYSQQFFRRYYTPDNCTVIVAGDVDHDRLMTLARQHYGSWRGRRFSNRVPREPEPRAGARRDLTWEGSTPPRMFVAYRAPSFDAGGRNPAERTAAIRETAALQVVHGLAFDASSPLYQRLVVDEQKVLELASWAGEFSRDPHFFMATVTLKPGEAFDPVLDAIQSELAKIGRGEVPAERIDAVKSHVRYALLTNVETPGQIADLVAQFLAVGGDLGAMDAYLEALAAVTPEDVARAASRYLGAERRFVVTLAPGSPPATAAAPTEGGAR
jgi:zinc protease